MSKYHSLGTIPPKRHIRFERERSASHLGEGIYYEHVVTTCGFSHAYSILYHLRPPTRMIDTELVGRVELTASADAPLRPVHLKSAAMPRTGDPITGRVPLMFNDDLACYRCRPAADQHRLYRNAAADEVIFVHEGSGRVETTFGTLPYRRGDYVVIPRTTIYRFQSDAIEREEHLVIESVQPLRLPSRYFNGDGQLLLGAPYSERDFHGPSSLEAIDRNEPTELLVKHGPLLTKLTLANHPLDVVGWDGFVYPYTFNAWDFEPLTGTVHLPPPYQQTFESDGFVICTFAPRYLDHHPQAVKVPYAHSNVQADEVLYYVEGQFGSRRGVGVGSLTLHPGGIPHGPHPGTIVASEGAVKTEEMAVMFDTHRPLFLTTQTKALDDPDYARSWLDEPIAAKQG